MSKRATSSVLFAAVLAITAACKKADTASGAGSGATADNGAGAAVGGGAGGGAGMSKSQGDDLGMIPVQSELVLGLDFAQAKNSQIWKELVVPKIADNMGQIGKIKEKCGYQPLDTLTSATIGISGMGGGAPSGAAIIHGLDKAKTTDCLVDKMKDELAAQGASITKDGDVLIQKDKTGVTSAMQFITDDTLLIAIGGDKAKLAEYAKGGSAMKTSPLFVDIFGKLKPGATVWGVLRGDSKALEGISAFAKFKAVYGTINVTDAVNVNVRGRTDSADQATAIATMAKGQLAKAKMFVDQVDVAADGTDVKVDATITTEKLKGLEALARMSAGMHGGGDMPPADGSAAEAPATP